MRTKILCAPTLLVSVGSALAQIPTPVPGWPYITRTLNFAFYANARFADEGLEKHVYFNTATGEMDRFQMDGSFSPGWPVIFDTLLFGDTPLVFDIDHDGLYEMFGGGTRRSPSYPHYLYSLLFLLDDNGSVMPGFPIRVQHPRGWLAADLDSDNEYEIIYYAPGESSINCIDRFAQPQPGWPIGLPEDVDSLVSHGRGGSMGSIGDLDLDGTNEVIVSGDFHIYAFRFDGSMAEGFPIQLDIPNFIYDNYGWSETLGDIDDDGYLEIMTAGNNWLDTFPPVFISFVAVYEHTGQMKGGWPIFFEGHLANPAPTPCDINGDGQVEIGIEIGDSLFYFDSNANRLPGWPVAVRDVDGAPRGIFSDIITVDLDGDGNCELFSDFNTFYADSMGHDSLWYYGHSYLYALDHTGQELPGYPIRVHGAYLGRPPHFSLDSVENRLYMTVVTEISDLDIIDTLYVEVYRFPDSTGPPDQWPMLSHDNLHTRNYSFQDRVSSVQDGGTEILPKTPILRQNYPNPFNYSTMVQYALPRTEHMTLTLYDIGGGKVANVYDGVMEAGDHKLRVTMQDVASGVYFLVLKTEKAQITRKMLLLK